MTPVIYTETITTHFPAENFNFGSEGAEQLVVHRLQTAVDQENQVPHSMTQCLN